MTENSPTKVTIIYYDEYSLKLHHEVQTYPKNSAGKVIIPNDFKKGKSIIAVCLGEVNILNKIGDRVMSLDTSEQDNHR